MSEIDEIVKEGFSETDETGSPKGPKNYTKILLGLSEALKDRVLKLQRAIAEYKGDSSRRPFSDKLVLQMYNLRKDTEELINQGDLAGLLGISSGGLGRNVARIEQEKKDAEKTSEQNEEGFDFPLEDESFGALKLGPSEKPDAEKEKDADTLPGPGQLKKRIKVEDITIEIFS